MDISELDSVPQWSKNFWNPYISPVTDWGRPVDRDDGRIPASVLFDNFYNGIKKYNMKWHDSDTHELFLKQYKLLNPNYHNKEINYTFNRFSSLGML